ncbi:MAG: hypothetical protein A4E61_00097 [Syntrophorhabdus sp. PtaB.Bin184]|nr:MAG: hypothetical protein A4E61_00097 [Syntrophorhabdus sp. PtaB.Bin184]
MEKGRAKTLPFFCFRFHVSGLRLKSNPGISLLPET